MALQAIAFYLLAAVTVGSGIAVVSARNPVHSVLFLILSFFSAAGLFVLLGAEFLAMLLVVVYVGAVAVLFLFVVMMLDINFRELRQGAAQYMPFGALLGLVLLAELAVVLGAWAVAPAANQALGAPTPAIEQVHNTKALGQLLYTHYAYLFQASGIVLLIAMMGAIVLTLRRREGVRKQDISAQLARRREETMAVIKVPTGEGV